MITFDHSEAILDIAPGSEKLVLVNHMIRRHRAVAEKVVAVGSAGHPSDDQLLANARKFFVVADGMRMSV